MGFLSAYHKWFRRPGEPFGVRSISRNTVIPVLAKATNIHILYKLVCIGDMTWDLLQKSSLLVAVCLLFQLLVQAICSSFYSIICKLLTSLQAWLLFFYTSLALRENILRVNGSDIRPWWVYHHYCAMAMALVSLTWGIQGHPSCIHKQQGVRLFLRWAVMQGVAMLLQNHYQRQRLYTRIALGKAGRMDVVWGETAGVTGQLWVFYPLLFTLQVCQSL
jgi:hypothetical protein